MGDADIGPRGMPEKGAAISLVFRQSVPKEGTNSQSLKRARK